MTANEAKLGPPVVAWFRERGFDCYQEVEAPGGIADVIAVGGPVVAVAELKTSLSLTVIAQAHRWAHLAHWTFAAVPARKLRDDGHMLARRILEDYGIGLFEVGVDGARLTVEPSLRRRAEAHRLRAVLRDEHKTFVPAGSENGRRWTQFRDSCARISEYVAKNPGLTLRELFDQLGELHWANQKTARQLLLRWIDSGVIEGLRVDREGDTIRIFPATSSKATTTDNQSAEGQ